MIATRWVMVLFAGLAAAGLGCGSARDRAPIPDSTMTELLIELHLANGRIEVTDQPLPFPRDSILQAYGVDSSTYVDALAYYVQHPERYSRIYGDVIDRLSVERIPPGPETPLDTLGSEF